MKTKIKSDDTYFRLSTHPNGMLSALDIRSTLTEWARQGWVPDVVCIDYADLLAPMYGHMDSRDQINATWKMLRAISQIFHCLVCTATQADAQSYNGTTITRKNFSNDKRILAHATGIVGVNVADYEKKSGIRRYNWVVGREFGFSESKFVHIAGCLALANPCVRSTF